MKILQKTVVGVITSVLALSAFAGTAAISINNNSPFRAGVVYSTHRAHHGWVKHRVVVNPHGHFFHRYHGEFIKMNVDHVRAGGRFFGPERMNRCEFKINDRFPHGRIQINLHEGRDGHGHLGCEGNRWK